MTENFHLNFAFFIQTRKINKSKIKAAETGSGSSTGGLESLHHLLHLLSSLTDIFFVRKNLQVAHLRVNVPYMSVNVVNYGK